MADNVTTQSGTASSVPAGTVIATDEVGGAQIQRVKPVWGTDGTANDISAANPLPVTAITSALPSGAATETTLGTRLSESDFDTKTGALTETAPATDTASSGLNGRLQRIAQRITSLIALLPTALGSGGGLKVDGSGTALPVSGTVALGAGSAVVGHVIADTGSTTAVTGNVATTVADGANVTLGAKADAKSTATDTTAITVMSVLKQISASVQAPPSQAVTNAGTFVTQPASATAPVSTMNSSTANAGLNAALAAVFDDSGPTSITENSFGFLRMSANRNAYTTIRDAAGNERGANVDSSNRLLAALNSGSVASGAIASGAVASGAIASGAVASGAYASGSISDGADVTFGAKTDAKSTATDATSITAMQVLKQISASVQAPPAIAAGTNTIGKVYASYQTTKALTNASVSASASGENTLVSGTGGQTIRVFKLCLVAASAVSVTLKDAAGGTALTGAIPLVANGALSIDVGDGEPAFVTASSGAFILSLSAAVATTGFVQYTKS